MEKFIEVAIQNILFTHFEVDYVKYIFMYINIHKI